MSGIKQNTDANLFNLQHELEELREKFKIFWKDGDIVVEDIEEALAMLRIKRERGYSLDYLLKIDNMAEVY